MVSVAGMAGNHSVKLEKAGEKYRENAADAGRL